MPTKAIFCAKRAWDQRAEVGYMKSIEDLFQNLADKIVVARRSPEPAEHDIVSQFFISLALASIGPSTAIIASLGRCRLSSTRYPPTLYRCAPEHFVPSDWLLSAKPFARPMIRCGPSFRGQSIMILEPGPNDQFEKGLRVTRAPHKY